MTEENIIRKDEEEESEDLEVKAEAEAKAYVVSEEIIETTWECARCHSKNQGRDMRCPTCGSPKTADAAYTVSADGPAVTDAAQLADAAAGLHWVCPYCEGQNRGNNPTCDSCGANVDPKDRKPYKGDVAVADNGAAAAASAAPAAKKGKSPVLFIFLGLVLIIIGYFVLAGRTSGDTAKIKAATWNRTITLEQKITETGRDWEKEIKDDDDLKGAYGFDCEKKVSGKKKVKEEQKDANGQVITEQKCEEKVEDLKNGYAKKVKECKDVPVFVEKEVEILENYCSYKIDRWKKVNSFSKNGTITDEIVWPEAVETVGADQRLQKKEVFAVTFVKSDGGEIEYHAKSEAEFKGYVVGETYDIVLSNFGKHIDSVGAKK